MALQGSGEEPGLSSGSRRFGDGGLSLGGGVEERGRLGGRGLASFMGDVRSFLCARPDITSSGRSPLSRHRWNLDRSSATVGTIHAELCTLVFSLLAVHRALHC